MKTYPLKFKPIFKERIWGGEALKSVFNKDIPADTKIGESWELADLPEDKSTIVNGEFSGKTLAQILEDYPLELTGRSDYKGPFPLLIKILDAQDDLSVQVHPDAQTCQRTQKGDPKTECWYIIAAKPGAVIYKGLKQGVTRKEFETAINNGSCADYIEKVEVKVGQCHFLPSGTIHAIGAGLLIAEIQQPSDTTYRVFDWNRVDSKTKKPRELHVKDALESIHFDSSQDNLSVNNEGRLVDSQEFKVDKYELKANESLDIKQDKMEVLVIITGEGAIEYNDSKIGFVKGDTIFIPYNFSGNIRAINDIEFLSVTI